MSFREGSAKTPEGRVSSAGDSSAVDHLRNTPLTSFGTNKLLSEVGKRPRVNHSFCQGGQPLSLWGWEALRPPLSVGSWGRSCMVKQLIGKQPPVLSPSEPVHAPYIQHEASTFRQHGTHQHRGRDSNPPHAHSVTLSSSRFTHGPR